MEDLKAVARVVRWGAESLAFQFDKLPADKLDWKPNPASKSALEIVSEVIRVMDMVQPLFEGGEFRTTPAPNPANLEEAKERLAEAAARLADGLDAAGPELERAVDAGFGPLWGTHAVMFAMVDLLHHHGQITYIQSLLGDAENHMDLPSVLHWFGPPQEAATEAVSTDAGI